jgi:hypothetical protein
MRTVMCIDFSFALIFIFTSDILVSSFVQQLFLDWPEECLLLIPPGGDIYSEYMGRPAVFAKLAVESGVRARGFSPTGRSLVLATNSDLTVWARNT